MPINVYKTDKQIVKVQSTGPQGPRGEQGVSGSTPTLPDGLVSGSSQIDFNGLNNKPSNLFSSSQQFPVGIVSSSQQIINNLPNGVISSSQQLPSGLISSSNQLPSGIISSSIQVNDTILDYLSFTGSDGYSFKKLSTLVDYTNFIGQYQDNSNFSGMFHNYSTDGQLTYGTSFTGDNISTSFFIDKYGIIYQQSSGSVVNGFNIYDVGLNLSANNNNTNILLNNIGIFVASINGITYNDDYSSTIKSNDRSIPDVGTIKTQLTASYAMNGRPYKVYTALLTQTGTSDPVAIVLENTIGNIVWEYQDIGLYFGTLNNAFVSNKTFLMLNNTTIIGDEGQVSLIYANKDAVIISSVNGSTGGSDNLLNNTSIEIRVYP